MAWPLDARIRTFSALQQIPSADLNAIQDRIVDLHRERVMPICNFVWEDEDYGGGEYYGAWYQDVTSPELGCLCGITNAKLIAWLHIPDNCKIKLVRAKVYSGAVASMVADCYTLDHKLGTATTAPTISASLATDSAAGTAAWDVLSMDVADFSIDPGTILMVHFTLATAADAVAGVYATYEPITPS